MNLLDEVLDEYKYKDHHVTMDSTYMGDIMAQIGRYEWQINMVGTEEANRTGADVIIVLSYSSRRCRSAL